jgi:hypothetical protein
MACHNLERYQNYQEGPLCTWAKRRWKGCGGGICLFCNNGCAEAFGASQSLKISLHNTSTKEIANTAYYKGLFHSLWFFRSIYPNGFFMRNKLNVITITCPSHCYFYLLFFRRRNDLSKNWGMNKLAVLFFIHLRVL